MTNESGAPADPEGTPDLVFPQANFPPVRAIAGVLETTLGPTPREKLIINSLATRSERDSVTDNLPTDDFVVTGDGKTILEELPLQHPVAPILRRIAGPARPGDTAVEGEDTPDGVTTAVVLLDRLLDEAESLMELGLHATEIKAGYETALEVSIERLSGIARPPSSFGDERAVLSAVAWTAMTGNDVGGVTDEWADLAVESVAAVGRPTPETFVVRQLSSGSIADSRLVRGAVLDRSEVAHMDMPRRLEDATVLVIGGQDKGGLRFEGPPEHVTADLGAGTTTKDFADAKSAERRAVVNRLRTNGVDVVVTRQGIDAEYERLLADAGIMGIDGVTKLDIKQVVKATGASPVLIPDEFERADLGHAGTVYEEVIEPRRHRRRNRQMVVFDACASPGAVTVVLRGVTDQLADQATTEIRNAAAAVAAANGGGSHRPGVVPGGGAADVNIIRAVTEAATAVDDREQLAMEAFADAVTSLVAVLVRNGGGDPLTVVPSLRSDHEAGRPTTGYYLPARRNADMVDAGVLDPLDTRIRAFTAATEVAGVLLKIDDTMDAKFSESTAGPDESIYDEQAEIHSDS
jgi:chaperonin GroEL (HSP60 family)